MTDRLHVDPASLEGIADQLGRSGDTLRSTASGSPGTPDAGADTPIFDELLNRLVQDAGALAGAAGDVNARLNPEGQPAEVTEPATETGRGSLDDGTSGSGRGGSVPVAEEGQGDRGEQR